MNEWFYGRQELINAINSTRVVDQWTYHCCKTKLWPFLICQLGSSSSEYINGIREWAIVKKWITKANSLTWSDSSVSSCAWNGWMTRPMKGNRSFLAMESAMQETFDVKKKTFFDRKLSPVSKSTTISQRSCWIDSQNKMAAAIDHLLRIFISYTFSFQFYIISYFNRVHFKIIQIVGGLRSNYTIIIINNTR